MSDAVKITGGCLCGAVRYESTKMPTDADRIDPALDAGAATCHCRMCQKALGAPFGSFVRFPRDGFRYTRGEPKFYRSSEIRERGFCSNCGTSIVTRVNADISDVFTVTSATLDDPNAFPPKGHYGVESQLHWLKLDDDLPRREFPDDFIERRKSGLGYKQHTRSESD